MSKKENTAVVKISAKDRARHTRAYNAASKADGTYRALIGELAKTYFPDGTDVAGFAKALEWDVSMGKKATIDKGEANRRRSRIADGLKVAGLLKVSQRAAQSQGKRRKAEAAKAPTAADKAQEAQEAVKAKLDTGRKPTQSKLFSDIVGMLDDASPATLRRLANELAQRIAAKAKEA